MDATSKRRRLIAPTLAAVATAVIAVSLVAVMRPGRTFPRAPVGQRPAPVGSVTDPRDAAVRTARELISRAAVLPGASRVALPPLTELRAPMLTPGAQHVSQSRFWRAPGTPAAAIAYLTSHAPRGMRRSGSATSSGPGGVTAQSLEFDSGRFATLQYGVVADHGGVAVRADAQVLWAPSRSAADTVARSVSSVDVLVVRQNPQRHESARTVRRTLHGAPAGRLADYVNLLPLPVPEGPHSCPAALVGDRSFDQLVFHSSPSSIATVRVDLVGCASTTFAAGHRKPIQLELTYPGSHTDLDRQIMSALGLPADYGN